MLSLCVSLSVVAVLILLLLHSIAKNYSLLLKVRQLETQNTKLHQNLQVLSDQLNLDYLRRGPDEENAKSIVSAKSDLLEVDSSDVPVCDVIHVAMVVSGSVAIRRLIVVVKSILFHCHNPLHFHLLTDPHTKEVLSTIFCTWHLSAVNVSFYSISHAIEMVEWIPNSHYSGVFGLVKLTLATILPSSLDAVIVLDTDLMLAADISMLWRFITHLKRKKKQLGLVENQSDWYLGNMWKKHKPWPAVGRGFNTGVILLNLELMRSMDWNSTWHLVAKEALMEHRKVALADQDVMNAVVKRDKDIVLMLPCVWNIQLSENTLSEYCFKSAHHFKIIHWNSAAKLDVKNIHAPRFKNLFTMFENYDSTLFKTHFTDCPSTPNSNIISLKDEEEEEDPCSDFRKEAKLVHRIHPFYLDYSYNPRDPNDVTLVTQMSMDRLHMLEPLCLSWRGPLSIALYSSDADLKELTNHIEASPVLRDHRKLALHIVSKGSRFYPVNHLRNIALGYARTPYIFLSDMDFLPMAGLYEYMKEALRVLMAEKRALIVPAFESLRYRNDFPANKSQVLSMLEAGTLLTFRYHEWREGHAPTHFEHWRKTKRPYKVKWAENFEPYVIVNRNVTRYDERFVGFGWNKVSHVTELAAQGYDFVVLPEAFMIHLPHAPSADITKFRQSKSYKDCMEVLKEFRKDLVQKYKNKG